MKICIVLTGILCVSLAGCSRPMGRAILRENAACIRGVVIDFVGEKDRVLIREHASDLEWEFAVRGNAAQDMVIGQDVEAWCGDTGDTIVKIKPSSKGNT